MSNVATFPKGKKKSKIKSASKNGKSGAKVWCQFDVSQTDRVKIKKAMKAHGHKTSADYAQSLILSDLKKLGSKLN